MFLEKLNEKEKDIFIELAVCISQADSILSNEEKKLFEDYGHELGKTLDIDFSKERDVGAILSECKDISDYNKKIICFELLGLALCDELDENEEILIEKIVAAFDITEKDIDFMKEIIKELFGVYKKIAVLFQ